ncbi:hypothetical protein ScPMuIL_017816 [Solemya velum]
MKKNLREVVIKICEFLGEHLDDTNLNKLVHHCSFESMCTNPMTNHHDVYSINRQISPLLRKGTVGDWKNHFIVNQNETFDKVCQDELGDLEIPFQYEI